MAAEEVLGDSIVKLLSDKPYEKRKQAALEIEAKVREALQRGPDGGTEQVQQILNCLKTNYVESQQSNHKKGGLIGLASVAIGLENEIEPFLRELVIPVLDLFRDDEARVRYYACEALYNISKVASERVLIHFNDIFDGLCKLYADVDIDVKNGVQVLDRLMKDIVTQSPSKFLVTEFVPLLAHRLQFRNPFIRQLVLAWIILLLKVPEIDMIGHIPKFLDGLFSMLGDQSRDVRQNADACLLELLKGISLINYSKALQIISETSGIIVMCCKANDACSRLTALCWLHEFVRLETTEGSHVVNRKPNDSWVAILPDILSGTLHCIDDPEGEIAHMAVETNNSLLEMVQNLRADIPVDKLVDQLLQSMQLKDRMIVRTACLQWICMLLEQSPAQMKRRSTWHRLCTPIFDTLLHSDDEVVVAALRVLAQIMEGRNVDEDDVQDGDGDLFTEVVHQLLKLFESDSCLLETRGRLMIRQLCGHLSPRRLYVTVAHAIQRESETDARFAQQLVQTFSWILLTSAETKSLREELLATAPVSDLHSTPQTDSGAAETWGPAAADVPPLFLELLEPWFQNPVSALALCLWAQQYELASELTARLAAFEPTLDLLKQLDQLVHLLESPVFSRLRLRLLEPRRHPALLKCLLGLAMLLPQAGAFSILRERISVVQSGLLLDAQGVDSLPREAAGSGANGPDASATGHMLWWSGGGSNSGARAAGSPSGASRYDTDLASLLKRFDSLTAAGHGNAALGALGCDQHRD